MLAHEGSAISGLAAVDSAVAFPKTRVSLLNFGMPRLGDKDFAALFGSYVHFSQARAVDPFVQDI